MLEITVDNNEARALSRLSCVLACEYLSSDSEALLSDLPHLAKRLPPRLREQIDAYLAGGEGDLMLIRSHMVSDSDLGPTPEHWNKKKSPNSSLEYEILTLLYGSVLGPVFGWSTQQAGHIVNDIIPVEQLADRQVGASSSVELAWHTEDAFHPGRADFICLFCLRNPTGAPTTVASLADVTKNMTVPQALFEACVYIAADDAQLAGAEETSAKQWAGGSLDPVPILTETDNGFAMRIDPAYMKARTDVQGVSQAVDDFCHAIAEHLQDIVLEPGDLLILDNRRVVHGRRPFKPRYRGQDRWLKRINVAQEFRTRAAYCHDYGRRLLA